MGKWSDCDTDAERLPTGMRRVGYDADTQVYTYRDTDGSIWQGASGARYGTVGKVAEGFPGSSRTVKKEERSEHRLSQLPDDVREFLMLSDKRQAEAKRPRSRYKPRAGAEPPRPPQRRQSTLGGLMQLLRRNTTTDKPHREGPRMPPNLQRKGTV